jgi:uncharacterized membrane protein YraQ (UPF0718 family)
MNELYIFIENFAGLFAESAPWLLLGLIVAGVMHEIVPISLLQKHMGSSSPAAIVKSAIIGAPLPLCSCGVIPAAVGLRRSGASKPATAAFLVSTPETGVDSVAVSYALLGPLFAIVRPITAILSGLYTGFMIKWFDQDDASLAITSVSPTTTSSACCSAKDTPPKTSSCCSTNKENTSSVETPKAVSPDKAKTSHCCSSTTTQSPSNGRHITDKISRTLSYASGQLLTDISLWLLIGLLLAAAIKTWVPTDFLTQWGDGFVAMLVMALVGVPMYICATASTPLAVGFLAAGLSPGAVLVFLLAGPATNISTMGMIAKELGSKALLLYLLSVVSASIGFGYGLNYLIKQFALSQYINTSLVMHEHGGNMQAVYALCAVVLAALMIRNGWQWLVQKFSVTSTDSCCH